MRIASPKAFTRDLSSAKKITDEEESIIFQLDQTHPQDSWCYDANSDKFEQKDFNPANPKYIILTQDGLMVDPKELSDFIKNEMEGKR